MAEQPITRLIARHGTGTRMDMIAAVLRCGCVVKAEVDQARIDGDARSVAGTLPCPAGHDVPDAPATVARCPDCGVELGGEVRDCDGHDGHFGWTGKAPCMHLASTLQQLTLYYASHPWGKPLGWYCMGCSLPPR